MRIQSFAVVDTGVEVCCSLEMNMTPKFICSICVRVRGTIVQFSNSIEKKKYTYRWVIQMNGFIVWVIHLFQAELGFQPIKQNIRISYGEITSKAINQ